MGKLEVCSLVMKITRVIVLIESSRSAGRGLLRGITKYAQLFGPWIFYRGAPFYRSSSHVSEVILDQKSGRKIDMAALIKKSDAHGIITYISDLKTARMNIPKGFPAVVIPLNKVQKTVFAIKFTPSVFRLGQAVGVKTEKIARFE